MNAKGPSVHWNGIHKTHDRMFVTEIMTFLLRFENKASEEFGEKYAENTFSVPYLT
ncbi:MAG: hypothetical protein AAF969_14920 [Bacteroidota bacterium]